MFRCVRWNGERIWERYGLLYSKHDAINAKNIGIKYNKQETRDEFVVELWKREIWRALGKATEAGPGLSAHSWRAASNAWFRFDEPQPL